MKILKNYFLDTEYKSEFKSYLFEILEFEEDNQVSVLFNEIFSKNQLLSIIDLVDENVFEKNIKSKDASIDCCLY